MRKTMIAAVAALTAMSMLAVTAVAQTPGATLDIKLSPKKAGTKKKPKNSTLTLAIENGDTTRTMSKLVVTAPKTVKLSGKGLTKCAQSAIELNGPDGCPRGAIVGRGIATARVGVNTPNPSPLTFDVTAIVMGNKSIGFHLVGRELPVVVLAPGKLSGRKMTIDVPMTAQQPAPGVWAGLVSLNAKLKAKKGKNYLISTTDCKKRKQAFSTQLTFVDNTVSAAGTVSAKDTVACS